MEGKTVVKYNVEVLDYDKEIKTTEYEIMLDGKFDELKIGGE